MVLLPDERVVLESDNKTLVLTSHRVRYHTSAFGSGDVISMMLEEVSSCGLVHTSHPVLLIFAAVCGLAFVAAGGGMRVGWLLIGGILLAAYFTTRRHVLAIASPGHTIKVAITGMSTENVMRFLEETEAAKNARRSIVPGS